MPSDTSPVVTKRHSAMSNLRAGAVIIVLRVLPRASAGGRFDLLAALAAKVLPFGVFELR
jgi:hypothetical protein